MYTESGASVISITTNIDDLKADFIIFPYVERKAFSSEIHFHSYFQCQCILLGAIDCVSINRKLLAYQGDIFFIPAGVEHLESPLSDNTSVLSILLKFTKRKNERKTTYDKITSFFDSFKEPTVLRNCKNLFDKYINNIYKEIMNSNSLSFNRLEAMFTLFLLDMTCLETFAEESDASEEEICDSYKIIEIELYVERNLYLPIGLSDLAENMHFSEKQLNRIIKNATGMTFSQFLKKKRLTRAKYYIENTNLRFHEIAVRVGYETYSGFFNAFTAYYGKKPQQMRK